MRAELDHHERMVWREFLASALYVAIVLLAVLVAAPDDQLPADGPLFGLLAGTAVGLTLAHWVAFRLASRATAARETDLVAAGKEALALVAGGLAVVVVAGVPFLFAEGEAARDGARLVLAAMPAVTGAAIARGQGRSWPRVIVTGVVVFLVALVVAVVKNTISH